MAEPVNFDYNPVTNELDMVGGGGPVPISEHQAIITNGVQGVFNDQNRTNTTNAFGRCHTASNNPAKRAVLVSAASVLLTQGLTVRVGFDNANTADNPTLAINGDWGFVAANIYVNGAQITTGDNKGLLCGVCEFVYDGTNWNLIGNHIEGLGDVTPVIEAALCELNAEIQATDPEETGDVRCHSIDMDSLPKVCGYPLIYFGADSPTRTPDFVGQFYISGWSFSKDNVLVASGSAVHVYMARSIANAASYVRLDN